METERHLFPGISFKLAQRLGFSYDRAMVKMIKAQVFTKSTYATSKNTLFKRID